MKNRIATVVAAMAAMLGSAQAAVDCPVGTDGHRLARQDGVSFYTGDPAANMLLAPDIQAADMRGINVWNIPDPSRVTIVCAYEGRVSRLSLKLTPGVRSCTQDLAARTLSCR